MSPAHSFWPAIGVMVAQTSPGPFCARHPEPSQ
jgi:hypothetical protein